jgi:integrase
MDFYHTKQFLAVASVEIRLAFALAIATGQRQGDLIRLQWAQYNGKAVIVAPRKTSKETDNEPVIVRIVGPLLFSGLLA